MASSVVYTVELKEKLILCAAEDVKTSSLKYRSFCSLLSKLNRQSEKTLICCCLSVYSD